MELGSSEADARWFIIRVQGGQETNYAEHARAFGKEVYFPMGLSYKKPRHLKKVVPVRKPVFRGYVFSTSLASVDYFGWAQTLRNKEGDYYLLADSDIRLIRTREVEGDFNVLPESIRAGDTVIVKHGLLLGLRATVTSVRGSIAYISIGIRKIKIPLAFLAILRYKGTANDPDAS